jgi:hypothetical protein
MIRGRNIVESTLRNAAEAIDGYLAQRSPLIILGFPGLAGTGAK